MNARRILRTQVAAGCRKNACSDKPYEDAFWLNPEMHVFCVADGITRTRINGIYPSPSPASFVANTVVSTVERFFNEESRRRACDEMVVDALRTANQRVCNYIFGKIPGPEFPSTDMPGAVATILALNGDYACFAHIGDCIILHFPDGDLSNPVRLTEDQPARAREWLTETSVLSREDKMRIVRNSIRNAKEHPLAFGALSGQDEAMAFVQTGRVKISSGDTFLMCSDGLDLTLAHLEHDRELQRLVEERDVEGIMDYADELEHSLRARSDDKTLIIIEIVS